MLNLIFTFLILTVFQAAFIASSDLKNVLLKGAFDILNCHGHDIFVDCEEEQLDSTVENLLLNLEVNYFFSQYYLYGYCILF